jgi:hypothetical protein
MKQYMIIKYLSPGQSHSDYGLIDTFGNQASSVQITELQVNVYY